MEKEIETVGQVGISTDRVHFLSLGGFSGDQNPLERPIITQVGVKDVIFDLV